MFTHGGKNSASYKILRNRVQREIKRAKHYYYSHKVSDLENTDMKKSWKEIKSLTGQNIQQEWFHHFLDDKCPDTKSLANRVNDHFINLTADFERIQ